MVSTLSRPLLHVAASNLTLPAALQRDHAIDLTEWRKIVPKYFVWEPFEPRCLFTGFGGCPRNYSIICQLMPIGRSQTCARRRPPA